VAGGVLDRVLTFLGFEEVEEEPAAAVAPVSPQADGSALHSGSSSRRASARGRSKTPATAGETHEPSYAMASTVLRSGKVARLVPSFPGLVVVAPRRFEDAQEAADSLKQGKPVIVQVDGMEPDLAKRIIHFLMGATYALGGEMHRIGAIVLFVPAGVEVTLPLGVRVAERETQGQL